MKMKVYNFRAIEPKWQRVWAETGAHRTSDAEEGSKYYCLDMFPYPSGSWLHVGHWRGYVISDVWSRYKKLQGFNVLHPMGWDSFGLPAENDAIKKGIHPQENTVQNITNMKRQLKQIGAMYDWDREITTSLPEYYHWTQWIFLQMYKKGLAYRQMVPINWCPKCKTGLANEEVVDGRCERCGELVTKKEMLQWMLKITDYADQLLGGLERLDWSEKIKTMQVNWIGRSQGADVTFEVISPAGEQFPLKVFTTRPDTLFGTTYLVLAPEHPAVPKLTSYEQQDNVNSYVEGTKQLSEVDRISGMRQKTGVFTGNYAINPVNSERLPIWISDYVLLTYGTGAIMCVPAHDQRDFEFAKQFDLPIVEVIAGPESKKGESGELSEAYIGAGIMVNSGRFNGLPSQEGRGEVVKWLAEKELAEEAVRYKLRDWVFSRQRYWGEPIPIIYCPHCGEVPIPEEQLPVLLPEVERYQPTGTGESPLAAIPEFVNTPCPKCGGKAKRETNTMPQWAGSCWYFLRYPSSHCQDKPFDPNAVNKWLPVDMYIGGIEHAILHLLYARFFTKVLYDLKYINFDEPFLRLFNQGMVCRNGAKMSKSKGNVVSPDELVEKYGTDTVRLYELFIGPPEQDAEWSDRGIEGIHRFLNRVWKLVTANLRAPDKSSDSVLRQRHLLVKNVTEGIESFKFNTTISRFMEFVNFAYSLEKNRLDSQTIDVFLILLSAFAPHMAEELWQQRGHQRSIFGVEWPTYDQALTRPQQITLVVQVNGKVRAKLEVEADIDQQEAQRLALEAPNVKVHLAGREPRKVIVVPNRLVNIVV